MNHEEKKEKILRDIARTQELNRKFRIMGVSISEATIEDYKIEVDSLNKEIAKLLSFVYIVKSCCPFTHRPECIPFGACSCGIDALVRAGEELDLA